MIQSHRPLLNYLIEGKEIKKIVVYSNGRKHFQNERGWLEHTPIKDGKPTFSLTVRQIFQNAYKAKKEDLRRSDCYYTGTKETGYTLYLHAQCEILGEYLLCDGLTQQFVSIARFDIGAQVDDIGEVYSVNLVVGNRYHKTEGQIALDTLHEQLKADTIEITSYELAKLMKLYDIKRK